MLGPAYDHRWAVEYFTQVDGQEWIAGEIFGDEWAHTGPCNFFGMLDQCTECSKLLRHTLVEDLRIPCIECRVA